MNNITDAIIRAVYDDCRFEKKDLFFRQGESVSPYIETAFSCLNYKHVDKREIEINVLCRFAEVFQEMLHPNNIDTEEKKELCNYVLDILMHYFSQIDLRHGLSKNEYISYRLKKEICEGYFGEKAAMQFKKMRRSQQIRLAMFVYFVYIIGTTINSFKSIASYIFPKCRIYHNKVDSSELYVHIPYSGSEEDHACMDFIIDTFLPLGVVCRVFWKEHFGIVDIHETMVLDHIALF